MIAVVTGLTGQFSSYMVPYLLSKGYTVVGTTRRRSDDSSFRLTDEILKHPNFILETVDILDSGALNRLLSKWKPHEFYHAAAQSFVKLSWDEAYHTGLATGLSIVNVLEAIRQCSPDTKLWFAGSSEQFGRVLETPQSETTGFAPLSPYAASKCYAYHMVKIYRESFGLFACSAIMFNYESKNRGIQFVTRKVTDIAARIYLNGGVGELSMGNLEARRDWSHCSDMVNGAHLMLQNSIPTDYVLSSDVTYTVREFVDKAFKHVGLDYRNHVVYDEKYARPNDVDLLLGNSSKIRKELGWSPKYNLDMIVAEMVDADLERVRNATR